MRARKLGRDVSANKPLHGVGLWLHGHGPHGMLAIAVAFAALVLALYGRQLGARIWLNLAMAELARSLTDLPVATPVALDQMAMQADTSRKLLRNFEKAASISSSARSLRGLGKAALLLHSDRVALKALEPIADKYNHDQLFIRDLFLAFARNGTADEILAYYDSHEHEIRSMGDVVVNDLVAWAILSKVRGGTVSQGERERLLRLSHEFRPVDLYANYHLWKLTGDPASLNALVQFPKEAVEPRDQCLVGLVAEVIPDLVRDGIWDRDEAFRVTSFLVTAYSEVSEIGQLLDRMSSVYPADQGWRRLGAELLLRRGAWKEARDRYSQMVMLDSGYHEGYLKLGLICEQSPSTCDSGEACKWFRHYNQQAGDDALGIAKQAQCMQAQGQTSAQPKTDRNDASDTSKILERGLNALTRLFAPIGASVAVEPGILPDFGKDQPGLANDHIIWKAVYTRDNPHFDPGSFAVSLDRISGYGETPSAFVSGFWRGESSPNRTRSMNGYQAWNEGSNSPYRVEIGPGAAYVLSFVYRTEAVPATDERVFFVSLGPDLPEIQLGPTDGRWLRYVSVLCNPLPTELVIPGIIFRSSLLGRVWFDEVHLQQVQLPTPSSLKCDGFLVPP